MRNRIWHNVMWALVGTVFGAIVGPMMRPRRKPLVERSADAIRSTTDDLMRQARRARKRIIKKVN